MTNLELRGEIWAEIQPGHPGTNVDGEESKDGIEQGGGGQRSEGFECKARP